MTVERRLAALRELMATSEVDAFVTSCGANARYLTGFSGSNALLWVDAAHAHLFTDGRYAGQVLEEVPAEVIDTTVARDGVWEACREWARSARSIRHAAFESDRMSYDGAARLAQWSGWEWAPQRGWVEGLRERKDAEEVAAIRAAAEIALASLRETLALVRPGLEEAEVAAELEYRVRRAAPEGTAFETIVLCGERSAMPHGRTGKRKLRPGDWLLIDFGVRWDGYSCDLTRTSVVGEPTRRQRDVHQAVCRALEAAAGVVRAGVEAREVDAAARALLSSLGFGEAVRHSTGHGIGLEVHEGPRLHKDEARPLAPGMVVTVEPGLYFPGWGGVRVEDDYWVTESGTECLTPYPRALQGS